MESVANAGSYIEYKFRANEPLRKTRSNSCDKSNTNETQLLAMYSVSTAQPFTESMQVHVLQKSEGKRFYSLTNRAAIKGGFDNVARKAARREFAISGLREHLDKPHETQIQKLQPRLATYRKATAGGRA